VAQIKIAYVGGGSTRAAGTMASLVDRGESFAGSEVVLIDLDSDRLDLIRRLAERMARARGVDLTIATTTDRRAGLDACDAVLTSFRPGGFEARVLDERIPLRHGVIGQETQGPGGFFMALRSIHVMQEIAEDINAVCPNARIFNYTNPVNIVAEAMTHHTDIPTVSLCEGPIIYPRWLAAAAGLDPEGAHAVMVGLNHGCWSVEDTYNGGELIPLVREAWERKRDDPTLPTHDRRLLRLAATMEAIPADYFLYYYFEEEVLAELSAKPTTRAEDILSWVPGYWEHYAEEAEKEEPSLDPAHSRGGLHELELALDAMDAICNDRGEVLPVNVPNRGSIPGFPDDLVVETTGRCNASGIDPLPQEPLPRHVAGLVEALAEYQALAAEAAWSGTRVDGIRALAANPLVRSLGKAEAIYDEMAAAHRDYLPERLLR
jgi:6-phospho-beta-glucosidase